MITARAIPGVKTLHQLPITGTPPYSVGLLGAPAWVTVTSGGALVIDCPPGQVDPVTVNVTAGNTCGSSSGQVTITPTSAGQPAPRGATTAHTLHFALDADGLMGLKKEYEWDRFHPINVEPQYYTYLEDRGGRNEGSTWVWGPSPLRINPHVRVDDYIALTADKSPEAIRPWINNMQYTSGLVTTADVHLQEFGWWELEARMSAQQGNWGGFWLGTRELPPEIDFEWDGGKPTKIWLNSHDDHPDPALYSIPWNTTTWTDLPGGARIDGWHTYGIRRTFNDVQWYFDGQLIGVGPNYNRSAGTAANQVYTLVNLALSNNTGFISPITTATPMPTTFDVRALRIYSPT